ncbi:putative cryptochrome [Lasiosphaeria ovina]|uniref:Cryptochrome DASH n=1 Tax=Lasiosphaeria ovina TaxID=92902 RepID=A0AAE0TXW5_9PEZI|nr:putative cryptochrome [Lasiosphaeria ovina]
MSAPTKILIYLLRRDIRIADNPVLNHLVSATDHGFTHLLPVYVFPANQTELSGFIRDGGKNPYPEARSSVGGYWRCGPHRAKFMAEAVWDLKKSLESVGSGLVIRVGMVADVVRSLVEGLAEKHQNVGGVWMVSHEGTEEKFDEQAVSALCDGKGADFKLWVDEKYFIDDRDVSIDKPQDLPDVFTTYRKSVEPLREKPRAVLPRPENASLPPILDLSVVPPQTPPFSIPETLEGLVEALTGPVKNFLPSVPRFPKKAESAHPFEGGETAAHARLSHLIKSEGMKNYKDTRNGLIGTEFSTKLSAYLAQGCITARQIHHALLSYEDGTDSTFEQAEGYGAGQNDGTAAIRFELLWRDYMRLCHQKFKHKLFRLEGFKDGYKDDEKKPKWKSAVVEQASPDQNPGPGEISSILQRFMAGTTGMGLIDASQREMIHTGYTSNRARQNVASFLAKHLGIDWRYGAEWYEMLLVDYDVSSNWANWQYVSGVGNDPRGEMRIFNPVKQAFDYDKEGRYVRAWVPEVDKLEKLENVFQAWTASEDELRAAGLEDNIMVTDPVKRIEFSVDSKPRRGGRQLTSPSGSESKPFEEQEGQDRWNDRGAQQTSDKSQGVPSIPPANRTSDPFRGGPPRGGGFGRGGRNGHTSSGYQGRHQGGYYTGPEASTRGIGGAFRGRYPLPAQERHWGAPLQHDG